MSLHLMTDQIYGYEIHIILIAHIILRPRRPRSATKICHLTFIRFCCSFRRTSATFFTPRSAASTSRHASWCSCTYAFTSRRRPVRAAASGSSHVRAQWCHPNRRTSGRPASRKARRPPNRKSRLAPRWRTSPPSRTSPCKSPLSPATLPATLARPRRILAGAAASPWRRRTR